MNFIKKYVFFCLCFGMGCSGLCAVDVPQDNAYISGRHIAGMQTLSQEAAPEKEELALTEMQALRQNAVPENAALSEMVQETGFAAAEELFPGTRARARDYAQAISLYRALAVRGNGLRQAQAYVRLGQIYVQGDQGHGVVCDRARAARYFERVDSLPGADNATKSLAYFLLAKVYVQSNVPDGALLAHGRYQQAYACALGARNFVLRYDSCLGLGELFARGGNGMEPDTAQAIHWYAQAAQAEDLATQIEANDALGRLYVSQVDFDNAWSCFEFISTHAEPEFIAFRVAACQALGDIARHFKRYDVAACWDNLARKLLPDDAYADDDNFDDDGDLSD